MMGLSDHTGLYANEVTYRGYLDCFKMGAGLTKKTNQVIRGFSFWVTWYQFNFREGRGAGDQVQPHGQRLNQLCLHNKIPIKLYMLGAPGWLTWVSFWLLVSVQVMISGSWDRAPGGVIKPHLGLCTQCGIGLRFFLTFPLPLPLLMCAPTFSLSQMNKCLSLKIFHNKMWKWKRIK